MKKGRSFTKKSEKSYFGIASIGKKRTCERVEGRVDEVRGRVPTNFKNLKEHPTKISDETPN